MRICTIASGSKGNCILVFTENTSVIIDMGISYKEYKKRLSDVGFYREIDGVLITHMHNDHIKGINQMLKRDNTPIFSHKNLAREVENRFNLYSDDINVFTDVFSVGDIDIMAMSTPHDTDYSYAFCLTCGDKKITIATDLGHITPKILSCMIDSDMVYIESNYDYDMLLNGSYPQYIIDRIASSHGHLSNEDCANTCVEIAKNKVKKIMLGHISENNNTYDLALKTVVKAFEKNNLSKKVEVYVAYQHEPSDIYDI